MVWRLINQLGCWESTHRILKSRDIEFVNHSRVSRDLRILLVFYQHPAWPVYQTLYNNQINARALIGQSVVGYLDFLKVRFCIYCASKPTDKSHVF